MTTAIAHHFFRRRPLALALAAVLALASIGSTAAPVSISDTPIATGVASTVKPNLMFILDDSTSMSFEFISKSGDYPEWGADKVGRYAAACNRVYYDPTITYSKPPTVAGLPIGTAFGAAPLDGFNRFDVTSPRVWDQPTPSAAFAFNSGPRNGALEASLPSNPVVALGSSYPLLIQRDAAAGDYWVRFPAGFYYELTAAGLLTFDPLVDCQVPISTASPKWNLVMASSLSLSGTATAPNSRQNFANWYSYYRTRINAMKSATGRAFDTVDAGTRIGMVTINPMNGASVDPAKYLPIDDFDGVQRTAWIAKVYDQKIVQGKLTPLVEALSRVGRHYAGVTTGINAGMAEDPVQYSCQRNISLLTTDGFYDYSSAIQPNGGGIPDIDRGTQCTLAGAFGGPACPVAPTGQVARPFNDEMRGTAKVLDVERDQKYVNVVYAPTFGSGSNECAWLGTRAAGTLLTVNPNTSGANPLPQPLPATIGGVPIEGWVPVYKQSVIDKYLRVKPEGYTFEVNTDGGTTVLSSGPDTTLPGDRRGSVYFMTDDPTRGCRPWVVRTATNAEGTVYNYGSVEFNGTDSLVSATPRPNQPWNPIAGVTLADVAKFYYMSDLRGTAAPAVTATNVVSGDPVANDNVPGSSLDWRWNENDVAPHQHMTTFTLGFGVTGALNYQTGYDTLATGDFTDIRNNNKVWLAPALYPTYVRIPTPTEPNYIATMNALDAAGWNVKDASNAFLTGGSIAPDGKYTAEGAKIDDLWHAAVNGRGLYLSAQNAEDVVDGLMKTLARIARTKGAGASFSGQTLKPTAANNSIYLPSYVVGDWSGELEMRKLDVATGAVTPPIGTPPLKSAAAELVAKVGVATDSRDIKFLPSGTGPTLVDFKWASLPASVQAVLDPRTIPEFAIRNPTVPQQALVDWLHGQSEYEDSAPKPLAERLFRARTKLLGDLVSSQPLHVGEPWFSYGDTGYSAFRSANAGRTAMVYVGANDGMLHAFDANTLEERWAVVPHMVVPNLPKLASRQYGARHKFFVDGTPTVSDICATARCGTAAADQTDWRTILVGGLNAGGEGYYALDITNPTTPQALWTFTNADLPAGQKHLGKSFGNPFVTKRPDGTWVVLVTSGYASATGRGVLYVLNAKTGALLSSFNTDSVAPAAPAGADVGLAKISAWVDAPTLDNKTRFIYGGDLLGNVYRFDLDPASTAPVHRVGIVTNNVNTPLPITVAPELAASRKRGGKPMVFVTTGKYLSIADATTVPAGPQAVFAFVDDHTTVLAQKDRAQLQACTITQSLLPSPPYPLNTYDRSSGCSFGIAANTGLMANGWYTDMPANDERIVLPPQIQLGTLVFVSSTPAPDPCDGGGANFLHYVDFESGSPVSSTNASIGTAVGNNILAGGFIYIDPATGKPTFGGQDASGNPVFKPIPIGGGPPSGRRVNWRELTR